MECEHGFEMCSVCDDQEIDSSTKNLLLCPHCASKNISSNEILGQHKDGNVFGQTACNNCGACGPEIIRLDDETDDDFKKRVDSSWNTRKGVDHVEFLTGLHDQIGDDKWTITFQSTGQILGAIRKAIREHLA